MKNKLLLLLSIPLFAALCGCGTLTANSAVSARKIKKPDEGTVVYLRHSTKTDPNTISKVNDIQDLRLAIKGDVEEASGGFLKNAVNLFKPTTRANRTFSEAFIASDDVLGDDVLKNLTDKIFEIEAAQTDYSNELVASTDVNYATNRINKQIDRTISDLENENEKALELLKKLGLGDKISELSSGPKEEVGDNTEDLTVEGGDQTNLIKESTNDDGSVSGRGAVVLIAAKYTGLINSVSIDGQDLAQSTDWERLPNGKREHWRKNVSASSFNGKKITVNLDTGKTLTGTIRQTQGSPFRGTFDLL